LCCSLAYTPQQHRGGKHNVKKIKAHGLRKGLGDQLLITVTGKTNAVEGG